MTVTYNSEVSSMRSFGVFWKLLFRWKGSIYKLVWPDLMVYIAVYFLLNLAYRLLMDATQRKLFEDVSRYCAEFSTFIPMSFVLGFYVTIVVQRWWDQYMVIPWPDSLAVYVSTNIHGNDDRGRIIRRTIMRYVNLSFTYSMAQVCSRVKKRFPTLEHFVEAGLMTDTECNIFRRMDAKTPHLKFWMPLVWAGSIVTLARKEGLIRDDFAVKTIIDTINSFRAGLGSVLSYDWISVPLVYTQTVTLAVYTFFIAELMGRQFVSDGKRADLYFPVFTFLQFFFFMGWLRVAETLFNPYGEDDDDFEINWMIDRNIKLSYVIVDEMHEEHPDLVRDQYWEEVIPAELPYTLASEQFRREPPMCSASQVEVKEKLMAIPESYNYPTERRSSVLRSPSRRINAKLAGGESLAAISRSSAGDLPHDTVLSLAHIGRGRLAHMPRASWSNSAAAGGRAGGGAGRVGVATSKTPSLDSRGSARPPVSSFKRSFTNVFQRLNQHARGSAAVSRTDSAASIGSRVRRTNTPVITTASGHHAETDRLYTSYVDLDATAAASSSQRSLDRRSSRQSSLVPHQQSAAGSTAAVAAGAALRTGINSGLRAAVTAATAVRDEPDSPSSINSGVISHALSSMSGDSRPLARFLPGDYNFLLVSLDGDTRGRHCASNTACTSPAGIDENLSSAAAIASGCHAEFGQREMTAGEARLPMRDAAGQQEIRSTDEAVSTATSQHTSIAPEPGITSTTACDVDADNTNNNNNNNNNNNIPTTEEVSPVISGGGGWMASDRLPVVYEHPPPSYPPPPYPPPSTASSLASSTAVTTGSSVVEPTTLTSSLQTGSSVFNAHDTGTTAATEREQQQSTISSTDDRERALREV